MVVDVVRAQRQFDMVVELVRRPQVNDEIFVESLIGVCKDVTVVERRIVAARQAGGSRQRKAIVCPPGRNRIRFPVGYAAPTFAGRAVKPITGKSWLAYLGAKSDAVYAATEPFGTELFGSRAIRQGDWKITDIGDGTWRLFNVAEDPGETRDLSLTEPERLTALIAAWQDYATRVGVVLPDQVSYRP